jgi:ornithine decarboxylase
MLPATLREGDRVYVGCAGAYTLSYASHFNGFPPPSVHYATAHAAAPVP